MRKLFILLMVIVLTFTGCAQAIAVTDDNTDGVLASDKSNEVVETEENVNTKEDASYAAFFKEGIHEIYIDIEEEDFEDILANPTDEEYHKANITLDGIEIENVAFRTKGNSTLRSVANSDSDRYSFKINVSKYEDQKLLGLDEFVLNNMFSDATYLREYISYTAMADQGMNVPLTSFVNVYVNGELYGFYLLVESVDDSFLNRTFGDNDGNLYRADMGTTLMIEDGEYIENVDQKNGDDESKTDLYNLMDVLNSMPEGEKGDIESVLDVTSVLKYIATNTLLENYDSLNGKHQQNYYLYNDNGIFTLIPWDYNMSFGGFGVSGQSTIDIDEPVEDILMANVPLINNLLAVEEYKAEYYNILNEYIVYFEGFEDTVTELRSLIYTSVEADPSKFSTMEFFELSTVYQEGGAVEVGSMSDKETMGVPNGIKDENVMPGDRLNTDQTQKSNMPPERPEQGNTPLERPEQGNTPPERTDQQGGMPPEGMVGRGGDNGKQIGNDVSIINILLARMENILEQLSEN